MGKPRLFEPIHPAIRETHYSHHIYGSLAAIDHPSLNDSSRCQLVVFCRLNEDLQRVDRRGSWLDTIRQIRSIFLDITEDLGATFRSMYQ